MSKKYLNYIHSLPCLICGKPSESAHQRLLGGGGTGKKPPDTHAVPLCVEHHREEHKEPVSFWLKYFTTMPIPREIKKTIAQLIIYQKCLELLTKYIEGEK